MTLDLSSLFHATIGFDDIARILNNFANSEQANTYPPYNISKIDDYTYRISIALAGFEINDINIILEKDILTISSMSKECIFMYESYLKGEDPQDRRDQMEQGPEKHLGYLGSIDRARKLFEKIYTDPGK